MSRADRAALTGKIWALAVSGDGARLASGAGDSVLTFWDDATAEQILEKETRDEELVLKCVLRCSEPD